MPYLVPRPIVVGAHSDRLLLVELVQVPNDISTIYPGEVDSIGCGMAADEGGVVVCPGDEDPCGVGSSVGFPE